jgi:hypothetical protein
MTQTTRTVTDRRFGHFGKSSALDVVVMNLLICCLVLLMSQTIIRGQQIDFWLMRGKDLVDLLMIYLTLGGQTVHGHWS